MDSFDIFGRDRRTNSRCKVCIEGVLFTGEQDISVLIRDFSEDGIGFEINRDEMGSVQIRRSDKVHITFLDNDEVINIDVIIRRITRQDGFYVIGGTVTTTDIGKGNFFGYVAEKKYRIFREALRYGENETENERNRVFFTINNEEVRVMSYG